MKRLALRIVLGCISLLACFGALSGCSATVPIDTSSSATAPVITWVVSPIGGGQTQTFGATGVMNIQVGTRYDVSMHAKTSSGVKTITVSGEEEWTCVDLNANEPTATQGDGDLAPQTVNQTAKNGQAQDELFSFQELGFDNSPCENGYTYSAGGYALDGTATNFANKQSTGHLGLTLLLS